MEGRYYQTTLKPSERPYPTLKYLVLDARSQDVFHTVAWCESEERAEAVVRALNGTQDSDTVIPQA